MGNNIPRNFRRYIRGKRSYCYFGDGYCAVLFTYIGIRILYISPRKKLLKLQNTYYGITDRRVLIMEFSDKVKIVPTRLSDIENYTRIVQLNGKGSITFQNNKKNKLLFGRWTNQKLGMYYISDVSNASKIIQNILS